MPAHTSDSISFDPSVIDQLACPACHGGLARVGGSLVCQSCGRAYPIVDGIPVLIADRAVSVPDSGVVFD
jgi:uncharacterized protein YbaR (Trm112 family)